MCRSTVTKRKILLGRCIACKHDRCDMARPAREFQDLFGQDFTCPCQCHIKGDELN